MGFRINRGIFQFKDAATETYINKFKIDERDGALVEVDSDGNAVTGYLKVGEKASDADKLDGINSSQFLRSDASDTMSGDLTISNGRITIKRGTGLTHAEWEDDSTANGRGQLILDSHYSDLIIASRNANSNKHGSTLTFATQSTSTNDVAKWVIGQGQYQEGANHLAFAYGTNQTNPHSILGTDNTNADFVIMDGRMVCIGGTVDKQAYSSTGSTRLMFGGANTDAQSNYYIGTNMEDYGGNYTKLDLRWHTGIRMGAQAGYGGIRFYDSEDLGSVIFSVGQGDANVRVSNSLYVLGSSNSGRLYADDFGIKVGTDAGYIQFGPANTSWAHIYTDRANFYFNKNIYVSGSILSTRSWAQGVADTAESNATAAANARIDDELVPQITANTDAITSNRNEITTVAAAAAAAQSTADGKANASHDHDRLYISDTRGAARAPSYYNDRYAQWDFQNKADTGITAGDDWQALLTVSKWSTYNAAHPQEQLIFTGANLYRRTATSDSAWGTAKKIWDSGNLNPIVGTSYNSSGDIITYTYADGTTSTIDIVDNNSNTYLTGASFNTSDGVLTLTRNSGSVTVDLDGRYDGVGSAAGVNTRIDDEIVPQITANATAITRNAEALDTKLASTGKAADSNLLDGVDSSRFVYGGNATKTTNISNVSTALASGFYDGYNITGSPTGTWYTYINMRHNNTGNNYGSQIAVSFYSNADMYVRTISNGTYQGWSKIWNAANFDPSSKANTSHDHNDLYYTKAQSNANYDAAGSADSALGAANDRMDNDIVPAIEANATNIARNATDIAGKANAGGSYSQDFAADDMRVDQWFRNTVSGKGLYNDATTQHWYSDSDDYWNIAGGSNQNGIRFRDEHGGTIRGYILANNSNQIGFLDAGGSWALRHDNDSGTYFYTDGGTLEFRVGRDVVTGNYGTVQVDTTRNSWAGYSIQGNYVFMSSGIGGCGIYNDVDNEWMAYFNRNGSTELHHNGTRKLETTAAGVSVTGTVTATSFSGSGAGLTNLPIPDQSIPVLVNGEASDGRVITLINFNLDRGSIDFTLSTGETFSAAFAR